MQTIVLPDGKYAVERPQGYRMFMVKTLRGRGESSSDKMVGKRWIYYRTTEPVNPRDMWAPFGFVNDDGTIQFFARTKAWTEIQRKSVAEDVAKVVTDPEAAILQYAVALKSLKQMSRA
jgi:hypothetical protein